MSKLIKELTKEWREYKALLWELNDKIDLENIDLVKSLGGHEVIGVDKDKYQRFIKSRLERVHPDFEHFMVWLTNKEL